MLKFVLDLFSSIWLGVCLLALLFIYCSVGSSGVPTSIYIFNPATWVAVREMRPFELTEFEWFHWWPFDLLMLLICINVTTATLRRIPLKPVNFGVWMIHSGIIMLCLGSVYYFSTKLEGDTPVVRRRVTLRTDIQSASMPAVPGALARLASSTGTYSFRISSIDPQWELLSGDDQGERAFSVNLSVQTPTQQYIRQVIAGYPQYTEDLVRTDDPNQPFKRAVKETGKPLVDETLEVDLAYAPQTHFYLMQSRAIYLRELGSRTWIMRPVEGLPRFNDYIASHDEVWIAGADRDASGMPTIPLDPIDVTVPAFAADDPLPGVDLHLTSYLRYAFDDARREPGGRALDPMIRVRFDADDRQSVTHELAAFDSSAHSAQGGLLHFVWADTAAAKAALQETRDSVLRIRVPEADIELDAAILSTAASDPALDFTPIEGTDYAYRVTALQDGLQIRPGITDNVAIVELRTPERTFTRWVFEDETLTRDLGSEEIMPAHNDRQQLDARIETRYVPGRRPAPVTVIGGPGERDLSVMLALVPGQQDVRDVAVGQALPLQPGVTMTIAAFEPFTTMRTKPAIVPMAQRDRDMGPNASMIQVRLPDGGQVHTEWLNFHQYAFEEPGEVLRRFPYQPKTVTLSDGRRIEMMFARQRMALPAAVALDDFVLDTHIGGFTGSNLSILDWTSMVTFRDADGWTEPRDVHMNAPQEHGGFWFFQAQWDPPDPPRFQGDTGSAGLNYTVLGVGNRNGVVIQLLGCCLSVIGMIFAFYVKPIIKRRQQQAVHAGVAARAAAPVEATAVVDRDTEPVGAGMEDQS